MKRLLELCGIAIIFFSTTIYAENISPMQHNQNSLQAIIKNNTNKPVIINYYINNQAHAGYFGLLVEAQSIKTFIIPEFFWFDKQAVGGIKIPGKPSQVKIIDVLKHGFANTLDISIPNEDFKTFFIKPNTFNVTISSNNGNSIVTLEEQK